MFCNPEYNNNKTRVSLHDIVRTPAEPSTPVILRKKNSIKEHQQAIEKIV
jgi:hypothetical protein